MTPIYAPKSAHSTGRTGSAFERGSAMREEIREIRRFDALADHDASRVTVIEFQTITFRRTVNGKLTSIEGPIRWMLTDGSQVNRMENKTYKVLLTGHMLRDVS